MRFARIFHNPVPKVLPACLMHSKTHRYLPLKNIIVINYRCFVYFSFFFFVAVSICFSDASAKYSKNDISHDRLDNLAFDLHLHIVYF